MRAFAMTGLQCGGCNETDRPQAGSPFPRTPNRRVTGRGSLAGTTMTTFADLGIPFPLFEAPTSETGDYVGLSTCSLCHARNRHCFVLDIGCAVIQPCPACGVINGLDANDREDKECRSCQVLIPFPELLKQAENVRICYGCLRDGRGAITKDTEFGMVSWEQAFQGVTNGVPGLQTDEFERVLIDAEEEWYGVRMPQEHLYELLRTPTFTTWQGELWLFCCKQPMTYIGAWSSLQKSADEAQGFFNEVVDPNEPSKEWLWEAISRNSGVCLYVFRCKRCGRFRSTYDMD
jgi:uncharacterized protein CbrC (UPF0167 family)